MVPVKGVNVKLNVEFDPQQLEEAVQNAVRRSPVPTVMDTPARIMHYPVSNTVTRRVSVKKIS